MTVRRTSLYSICYPFWLRRQYRKWLKAGQPAPPPHFVKQITIREYASKFGLPVCIETGTYWGNMIYAVKDLFEEIYSIELDVELYKQAKRRFAAFNHVTILHGDSGEVLKDILPSITRPCLFWLDGHFSADITAKGALETSIQKELLSIFAHQLAQSHVILIDDARWFTGTGDYPTLNQVREMVTSAGFNNFEVKDDIIRVCR